MPFISWAAKRFQCILCTPDNLTGNDRLRSNPGVFLFVPTIQFRLHVYRKCVRTVSFPTRLWSTVFARLWSGLQHWVCLVHHLVSYHACMRKCLSVCPSVCLSVENLQDYKADLLNPIITKKTQRRYVRTDRDQSCSILHMSSSDFHIILVSSTTFNTVNNSGTAEAGYTQALDTCFYRSTIEKCPCQYAASQ